MGANAVADPDAGGGGGCYGVNKGSPQDPPLHGNSTVKWPQIIL